MSWVYNRYQARSAIETELLAITSIGEDINGLPERKSI